MKIAVLLYAMTSDDHGGGLLPYVENLCHGLAEIGHKPRLFQAVWHEDVHEKKLKAEATIVKLSFGLNVRLLNKQANVLVDRRNAFPYKGERNAAALRERLEDYDAVIVINLPSYGNKHRRGDKDWTTVLEHGKPMIAIIHDCHWKRYYPWLVMLKDKLVALSAVHPATFKTIESYPGRIACVVNPFDISLAERTYPLKRKDWLCICSFFKAWKHVDDAVRMAGYLKPLHLFCIGAGIEFYNMKAVLKTEEEYTGKYYDTYKSKILSYHWKVGDPDVKKEWIGRNIFNVAEESGQFHHLGVKAGRAVSELQGMCGGLLDFAYHRKWGEHFNRALVEGMIHHCIPFARPFGISDNKEGRGVVFGPENAVLIPEEATPKQTADIIKDVLADDSLREGIVSRNLKKLELFDRRTVARHLVRLLKGKEDIGLFGVKEGEPDKKTMAAMNQFGVIRRYPRTQRFPRLK